MIAMFLKLNFRRFKMKRKSLFYKQISNTFIFAGLLVLLVSCGDGKEAKRALMNAIANKTLKKVNAYQIRKSFKRNNLKAEKVYLNQYVALSGGKITEISDYGIELGFFAESEFSKAVGNLGSQYGLGNIGKKSYEQVGTIECDLATDEKNEELLPELNKNQRKVIYGKITDLSEGIVQDIVIDVSGCFLYKPKKQSENAIKE